jgi:predicted metalloprotease with PDZ domain
VHLPVFLKLNLPHGWKVATSLPEREGGFSAKNYLTLVDAPVVPETSLSEPFL